MPGPELSTATGGTTVRLALGVFYSGGWQYVACAMKDGKWLIEEMAGEAWLRAGASAANSISFEPASSEFVEWVEGELR